MIISVIFMVALPHVTFEEAVVEDVLTNMKTYTDYKKQVLETISEGFDTFGLEDIATLTKGAGPALTGVSLVLEGILQFFPKKESAELKAITEGFKEMKDQFDSVKQMLREIMKKIPLHITADRYKDNQNKLATMVERLADIGVGGRADNTTDGMNQFKRQCEETDPLLTLNSMVSDANLKQDPFQPLITVSLYAVESDMRQFNQWLTIIANDVLDAATIFHACLGAQNLTKEYQMDQLNNTEQKIEDVLKNISFAVDKLKKEFYTQIRTDGSQFMQGNSGIKDHKTFATALHKFLSEKYYWGPKWLAVSYGEIPDGYSYEANRECQATTCVYIQLYRRSVFIAWCDMSRPNAFNDGEEHAPATKAMSYTQLKGTTLKWLEQNNFGHIITSRLLSGRTVCDAEGIIGRSIRGLGVSYAWADAKEAARYIKKKNWLADKSARGKLILQKPLTIGEPGLSMDDADCFVQYDNFCKHKVYLPGVPGTWTGEVVDISLHIFFAM